MATLLSWQPKDIAIDAHEEPALLARARQLEPAALAEIHDTYYTPVFRYVAFRVADRQTAEDLTSEVFLRLLSALRDRHAPQNSLSGWLYGVASRVVADYYRRHYRKSESELPEWLPDGKNDPEAYLDATLTHEQLHQALTTLTEEQQNVIALRFGYEMSIREVARTMGKNEGAIKQLQARAVAALSRILSTEGKKL
jgi:RNA polymerase sigma-70 factor, ECF subfamily